MPCYNVGICRPRPPHSDLGWEGIRRGMVFRRAAIEGQSIAELCEPPPSPKEIIALWIFILNYLDSF